MHLKNPDVYEIRSLPRLRGLWAATVYFSYPETLNGEQVVQNMTVTVRAPIPDGTPAADLEAIFLAKAKEAMARVLAD